MKILLVDDDRATLNALQFGLIRFGFEVETAEQGDHALSMIEKLTENEAQVSLLVTDLKMGRVSGLELIRAAKKLRPDLPCILMTAFGGGHAQTEVMKMNRCGYIEKPFSHESLLELIARLLRLNNRSFPRRAVRENQTSASQGVKTA